MATLEIRDSIEEDINKLITNLREGDYREAKALGINPSTNLKLALDRALYRKTAIVDNEVAAMWGVYGQILGSIGSPYLITATPVLKLSSIKFSRIYTNEVKIMNKIFSKLENFVDSSYIGAIRLLKIAGFKLSGPFYFGPTGAPFFRFTLED